MRDRLITLLGALTALVIVYALFLRSPSEPPVTKPLSTEAGRNGYLGLRTWLERERIAVVSWRERYGRLLEDDSLARTGNLLIVTMPFHTPLRTSEIVPLQRWVASGNTLLVLAALDDSPEWLVSADRGSFLTDLRALTALGFRVARDAGADSDDSEVESAAGGSEESLAATDSSTPNVLTSAPIEAETELVLEPVTEHPLLVGVESLHGFSDDTSALWRAFNPDPYRLVLRLATETTSDLDALWQLPRGRGQVVLSALGSLLVNRNVGLGDTRTLVANLVRRHVGTDGAVLFDDMHHGLSSLYDSAALFRDERFTRTIAFIVLAWLLYVVGSSNRIAPVRRPSTAPRHGDFLSAAGGLMARRLGKPEAGLLLIGEWLDEVRRARGLSREAELWNELERTPTLPRDVYEEIRRCDRYLKGGRSVDLVRLHNVLREAREAVG